MSARPLSAGRRASGVGRRPVAVSFPGHVNGVSKPGIRLVSVDIVVREADHVLSEHVRST